jgi:hypothetical protein
LPLALKLNLYNNLHDVMAEEKSASLRRPSVPNPRQRVKQMQKESPLAGKWTYRSFRNNPEPTGGDA